MVIRSPNFLTSSLLGAFRLRCALLILLALTQTSHLGLNGKCVIRCDAEVGSRSLARTSTVSSSSYGSSGCKDSIGSGGGGVSCGADDEDDEACGGADDEDDDEAPWLTLLPAVAAVVMVRLSS